MAPQLSRTKDQPAGAEGGQTQFPALLQTRALVLVGQRPEVRGPVALQTRVEPEQT